MKFAFSSFSAPQASLGELLKLASDYGYDGIEPRIDRGHGHGIEPSIDRRGRTEIRHAVEASGRQIACIYTSCKLADPATVDDQVGAAAASIELAAAVECPRVRVFGGKLGDGVARADAHDAFVNGLRQLIDPARRHGVNVCVETHDDWSDPQHVVAVMEEVDDPAIRVLWDVLHPVLWAGFSMTEAHAALAPWIDHVDVHDAIASADRLEFRPIGTGDLDHREVVRLLHESRYEGYLSGEWIGWEPAEVHLPRELATLRSYLPVSSS